MTTYDPLKAAKDPQLSDTLPGDKDIASIKRRERYTTVYMVEKDGKLDRITSYNVCYTKLLRRARWAPGRQKIRRPDNNLPGLGPPARPGASCPRRPAR